MKKRIIKLSNDKLLEDCLVSKDYDLCGTYDKQLYVYHMMAKKEILRRMINYQFSVKPLNKKLYRKVTIKL